MTESIDYGVLRKDGKLEVREYQAVTLVSVSGLSDNEAFGILFDYISGNNVSRQRIPMTAPVISSGQTGERIPMTAPVISGIGLFAFALPSSYTAETAPTPNDRRARLESFPRRKLAVLRFRGRTTARVVRARTDDLLSAIGAIGARRIGNPVLMRYNPPFVPGFLRRNEVAVEVELTAVHEAVNAGRPGP